MVSSSLARSTNGTCRKQRTHLLKVSSYGSLAPLSTRSTQEYSIRSLRARNQKSLAVSSVTSNASPVMANVKEPCCTDQFWLYIVAVVCLLLFSGLMSGLTLGLMSLGLVDLEVIKESGTPNDRANAAIIIPVVQRQHLLLVTLLVGNAVAMEALPLFLDSLTYTWMAILISVTLLLMFGEILPQAVCSRYGLAVGATMAPVVRFLLVVMFPIAWPVSKLLDRILGSKHKDLFRRAELITLVQMHGNEAGKGGELSRHETNLIAGTLQLAGKTVKDAMTPIESVISIDVQSRIDDDVMKKIVASGHSRIPVYSVRRNNIIGLILVKNFLNVTVDQHSKHPSIEVPIRRIQRVSDNMPLHDVLHDFCQRRSHIALVVRSSRKSSQEQTLIQPPAVDRASTKAMVTNSANSGSWTGVHPSEGEVGSNHFDETNSWNKKGDGFTNSSDSSSYFKPPDIGICGQELWTSWIGEEANDIVGIITREDVLEELLKMSLNLDKSECKVPIMDQQEPPVSRTTVATLHRTSPPQRVQPQPRFQSIEDAEFPSLSHLLSNASSSPVVHLSNVCCESPHKPQITLSYPTRKSASAPPSPRIAQSEHGEHTIPETRSNSRSDQSLPRRALSMKSDRSSTPRTLSLTSDHSTPVRALNLRCPIVAAQGQRSPAPARQVATHRILHSR